MENETAALFAENQLEAMRYTQIRLKMTDGSNVILDRARYDLEIPRGYQGEGKIDHQFVNQEDVTYELLLDFDAEKSITEKGSRQFRWSRPSGRSPG